MHQLLLKENNVPCELILKDGAAHRWAPKNLDDEACVNWFEKYMPAK